MCRVYVCVRVSVWVNVIVISERLEGIALRVS